MLKNAFYSVCSKLYLVFQCHYCLIQFSSPSLVHGIISCLLSESSRVSRVSVLADLTCYTGVPKVGLIDTMLDFQPIRKFMLFGVETILGVPCLEITSLPLCVFAVLLLLFCFVFVFLCRMPSSQDVKAILDIIFKFLLFSPVFLLHFLRDLFKCTQQSSWCICHFCNLVLNLQSSFLFIFGWV